MMQLLEGSMIVEIGELNTMARHDVNELKSFVTRTHDKARLPYGKRPVTRGRQNIFMGTTNDKEYLRDTTGNRRFWPVACTVEQIDLDHLMTQIDQVYAEVVVMYRQMRAAQPFGDLPLYLTDAAAKAEAEDLQTSRRLETPEEALAGQIVAWLDTPLGAEFEDLPGNTPILRNETCMAQIWAECLGKTGSLPQTEATKIGKALQMIGWKRSKGIVTARDLNRRYGPCRVYDRP
jgi:hypothetical protein